MSVATDELLSNLEATFQEGMKLLNISKMKHVSLGGSAPEETASARKNDESKAEELLRFAAKQGHVAAQCNLATLLMTPQCIQRNPTEAEFWFRKAAEQGDVTSQYNLGVMLFEGDGIPKNEREGVEWLIKAAAKNDKDAIKELLGIVNQDDILKGFHISDQCKFFILDIKHEFFVNSLTSEYINKLSKLSNNDKQAIIFYIVVFYKNDKKKIRELFETLKKNWAILQETQKKGELSLGNNYALHDYIRYIDEEESDKEIIDMLIELDNTVKRKDSRGDAPLTIAIKKGNEKAFNAVIAAGAHIYITEMFTNSEAESKDHLHLLLDRFFKKLLPKEKVLRMLKKLIELGSNPNIYNGYVTAAMRTIGVNPSYVRDFFDFDVAQIFLTAQRLDFTCKSLIVKSPELREYQSFLDYVTSEDTQATREAQQLVKDSIKDRFQKYSKRLCDLETEILAIIYSLPRVLGKIIVEYTIATVDKAKFIEYGSTENSLTFLYGLTEDRKFRDKIDERCAKLLTAPKT